MNERAQRLLSFDAVDQVCCKISVDTYQMFQFSAVAAGAVCTVLMDTGANRCFMSHAFVQEHNFAVNKGAAVNVELADGKAVTAMGSCRFKMKLGGMTSWVTALVLPEVLPDVNMILGMDWLSRHRARLHCDSADVQLYDGDCWRTLHGVGVAEQVVRHVVGAMRSFMPDEPVVSVRSVKRSMRRGEQVYLMVVKEQSETDPDALMATTDTVAATADPQVIADLVPQPVMDELLSEYRADVFPDEIPGGVHLQMEIPEVIPLQPGAQPYYRKSYRLSPAEVQASEAQIKDLLAKGWIEPSASPWGAPILFVPKKDGKLRMCVDFTGLNARTVRDRFPLPRIEDLLDRLNGSKVLTSLDLFSGYHQISLPVSDRHKASFTCPQGQFSYTVLPFGLTNAVSCFQRVLTRVMQPYIGKFVEVFLDDILIHSKSPEEHAEHLRLVFEVLRKHKLCCNKDKCKFNQHELPYLGMIVGRDGIRVDPRKVAVLQSWPVCKNSQEVRKFLGLANYFRRHIRAFSSIAAPLTVLTTHDAAWRWGEVEQNAFETLQYALTHAPVLAYPDLSKSFQVVADASLLGTGAVLMQEGKPVAYHSHKFSAAERNYTTGDQELLAVVLALREWRCYLEGAPIVELVSDHHPLVYLSNIPVLSRRQARWLEYIVSRFVFEWRHIPGRMNVADPISRTVPVDLSKGVTLPTDQLPVVLSLRADVDGMHGVLRLIAEHSAVLHSEGGEGLRESVRGSLHFVPDIGVYVNDSGKVFVPAIPGLRMEVIKLLHNTPSAGHGGRDKTSELVSRYCFWPGMYHDIEAYVRSCHLCQTMKPVTQKQAGLMVPLQIPSRPWSSVSTDLITGLPKTKSNYNAIAVFVCRLTKMVHFVPTRSNVDAVGYSKIFLNNVFKLHGMPTEIVSDRDPRFTSLWWTEFCKSVGIKRSMSTAYKPSSDGMTERVNRILEEYLRSFVQPNQRNWDTLLACAEFAVNNSYQASVQNTPFYLNYGRHPWSPETVGLGFKAPSVQVWSTELQAAVRRAKECFAKAQDNMKALQDGRRREVHYSVDQQVLLSSKNLYVKKGLSRKLLPKWVGPFRVVELVGPVAVRLELPEGWKIHDVFHVSLIRPYKSDGSVQPPAVTSFDVERGSNVSIERILDHRVRKLSSRRKVTEYLCKWEGQDVMYASWEPASTVHQCCLPLLHQYESSLRDVAPMQVDTATVATPEQQIHLDMFEDDNVQARVAVIRINSGFHTNVSLLWE